MRIDAHVHLWDLEHGDYDWLTPGTMPLGRTFRLAELEPQLDAAGVDAVVLVQAADNRGDTESMLAVAETGDRVAGVVGWIDLLRPADVDAALDEMTTHPSFKGVRHLIHGEPDADWLLRIEVRRSLRRLAERGLSFDVVGVVPRHLQHALTLARELPELRLVIDHLGTPPVGRQDDGWAAVMSDLSGEPNVFVKLSGFTTMGSGLELRPYVDVVLERFGPERTLYGSDWPVSTVATEYAETYSASAALLDGLSHSERDAVLGGTARRVYRL